MRRGWRLALSLLTVRRVDVPPPTRDDARWAMTFAPVVGLLVGLVAAVAAYAARVLVAPGVTATFAAVAGVVTLVATTRALHLDGLADTADGLGSLRPAEDAHRVMRQGDVGPFGVVVVVLVLVAQVVALGVCIALERGSSAVVVAAVTGRLAATLSCTPATRTFDAHGLGALVAGAVPRRVAFGLAALVAALAYVLGARDESMGVHGGVHYVVAVVLALAAAHWLRRRATARLGGVNGDVLGAQVEVATTVALAVLAMDLTCAHGSGLVGLLGDSCPF